MAQIDDLLKSDVAKGFALGVGLALVAPLAFAALAGVARPVARAGLKAGILVFEKGRETVAELGELLEDLMAEAQAELREGRSTAEGLAAGSSSGGEEGEVSGEAPAGESRG